MKEGIISKFTFLAIKSSIIRHHMPSLNELYSFLYLLNTVQYAAVLSCALISILHWPVYNAYPIVYTVQNSVL